MKRVEIWNQSVDSVYVSLKCNRFHPKRQRLAVEVWEIVVPADAGLLTGDKGIDVSGFGGDVGRTDLTDLHQQSCHVIVERREGLAEAHQAGQDGHEERVPLGPGQHWEEKNHSLRTRKRWF